MKQIEVTKFNTFENKLIKLNNQLVLLDKDSLSKCFMRFFL
jgi:hypothetical protein